MEFNNERRKEREREKEKVAVGFGKVQNFFSLPTIIIETNLYFTFSSLSPVRRSPTRSFALFLFDVICEQQQAKAIHESFKLLHFLLAWFLAQTLLSGTSTFPSRPIRILCRVSCIHTQTQAYIYVYKYTYVRQNTGANAYYFRVVFREAKKNNTAER
jgi:hypothetical protein